MLNNLVIYEIYVRNHGSNGTFADVEADLPRIKQMGVDVVWFMPIHPIGKVNKKGSLGCPYSISDYNEVNPEHGTKDDFKLLIDRAHALGLQVMIDVVYNHTAHDAWAIENHPEWYHLDENGKPKILNPHWSDVIDLNFEGVNSAEMRHHLINALVSWVEMGVDGFRCDVASVVPIDFWADARAACAEVNPAVIWLAESCHPGFVNWKRRTGLVGHSDSELYSVFDLTYDYDIETIWKAVVQEKEPVHRYLDMLQMQDAIYPTDFIKMRYVDNHDQPRILKLAPSRNQALAWTAFAAFNKGAFLIYAGQESANDHTPSLFDIDKMVWGDYELQPFLTALTQLKKRDVVMEGLFSLISAEPALTAAWQHKNILLWGAFNVSANEGKVACPFADGAYRDQISGAQIEVKNGEVNLPQSAVILEGMQFTEIKPFRGYFS